MHVGKRHRGGALAVVDAGLGDGELGIPHLRRDVVRDVARPALGRDVRDRGHDEAESVGEHHEALAPVGEPGHGLVEGRLAHRGHEHAFLAADRVANGVDVEEVVVGPQLLLLLQELERRAVNHGAALRLQDALCVLPVDPPLEVADESRPQRRVLQRGAREERLGRGHGIAGPVREEVDLLDVARAGTPRASRSTCRAMYGSWMTGSFGLTKSQYRTTTAHLNAKSRATSTSAIRPAGRSRPRGSRVASQSRAKHDEDRRGEAEDHDRRERDVVEVREEARHVEVLRAAFDRLTASELFFRSRS